METQMAGASFQQSVNIQYAAGVPGALYDDSPERSAVWELNSASAAYNIIGATAFTATSADPGSGDACGVAAAGGTGQFVGILSNSKLYANIGTSAGALISNFVLPNNVPAQLTTMGHLWVTLPGPANPGDVVAYDPTTGALSTYAKTTSITASLVASTGILTVTAVASGQVQVGQQFFVPGSGSFTITQNDSGVGGTGTYYTDYNVGGSNISSTTMTTASLPPPAFTGTASSTSTAGAMVISAVSSGELQIGSPVYGTGIPANAVVTAVPAGGGTGTYTISPAPATTLGSITVTSDALVSIPRAEVILFAPAGSGGLGVISLTNA
jgi:structural protein gp24